MGLSFGGAIRGEIFLFCFVLFCVFFWGGWGGVGVPSVLIRDTPRKKPRSNKTPTLSKSMNMNVCEVGTSNQLGS